MVNFSPYGAKKEEVLARIQDLHKLLSTLEPKIWVEGRAIDIFDRWDPNELVSSRSTPGRWVANPDWVAAQKELNNLEDYLSKVANPREKEQAQESALLAKRIVRARQKWAKNFKSPQGVIEVSLYGEELDLRVNLGKKQGSGTFCLKSLELQRSSYLTGEPRQVAEEFSKAIAEDLAKYAHPAG